MDPLKKRKILKKKRGRKPKIRNTFLKKMAE
jgi:hypothetical protein